MSNFNIQNSSELKNKDISIWRKGKQDIKKFYEVKFKKSTNIKTFLFGLLLTLICVLPFALLLIQFCRAYIYNLDIVMLIVSIGWVLLWICNGLSNYFTIVLAKLYFKEDNKLQSVDQSAVLFYEIFNPGFIVFSFFIIIFIFFGIIGG